MFSHILLALDLTPHAEAILKQARDLAHATGASVEVIHFVAHNWIEGQDLTMEDQAKAQAHVDHALLTLTAAGINAQASVVATDARNIGREILQHAHSGPDQLIILGSHHHHAWMTFLGAGTSGQITHQSPCPVLIVPESGGLGKSA